MHAFIVAELLNFDDLEKEIFDLSNPTKNIIKRLSIDSENLESTMFNKLETIININYLKSINLDNNQYTEIPNGLFKSNLKNLRNLYLEILELKVLKRKSLINKRGEFKRTRYY